MKQKIILICSSCLNRNYQVTKSMITEKKRLEIKKYCQHCNLHQLHKESR